MRRIVVVLGLALGFAWSGCDAPTFACGSLEHASSCYCKADFQPCNGLGACIAECPVGGE